MSFRVTLAGESLVEQKIRSFGSLPVGWRYGEGGPLQRSSIEQAIGICRLLYQHGLTHLDAFAGADGELMVAAYQDPHYIEMLIEGDGTITVIQEDDRRILAQHERLPKDMALRSIRDIAKAICSTSDLSTPVNMIELKSASLAWLSSLQPMGESLSFKAIALPGQEAKSAPTPTGTIAPEYIRSLSSSGNWMTQIYPPRAA